MADRIPIKRAEEIAKARGYHQVIVYARRVGVPGQEWVTTYGVDKTHCAAAARIGDAIGGQVVAPLEELSDRATTAERDRDREKERADGNWAAYRDMIRERDKAMAALRQKEERVKALENRYEDWKPVSEPPHQIRIERGELLSFYRDGEDGTFWSGTWSQRRDADIWCCISTAGLNERALAILARGNEGRADG